MIDPLTLWRMGYRPVAYPCRKKFSTEPKWQAAARENPPAAVRRPYDPDLANTGILTDGLRAIDIDLPHGDAAVQVAGWCLSNLGPSPIRRRADLSKLLLLYRSSEGCPTKRTIKNDITKDAVEVWGLGNQLLAFGIHPAGAEIEWLGDLPLTLHRDHLTGVAEAQIDGLLAFVGELIRATVRTVPAPVSNGMTDTADLWPLVDVVSALLHIPNSVRDGDLWFAIMCAVHVVSGGSAEGFAAFEAWSAQAGAVNDRVRNWQMERLEESRTIFFRRHARSSCPREHAALGSPVAEKFGGAPSV